MSPALTPRQWVTIILVNVVVSAITTLLIVRVVLYQSTPRAANAAPPAVLAATPTQQPTNSSAAIEPQPSPLPSPTAEVAQAETDTVAAPTSTATTAKPTAKASATANTATSTTAGTQGSVRIGSVLFPGQHQRESVVIANDSNVDVVMKGWVLASSRNISYTFGNVTLFRSNFISLHTTSGTDVPTDLFWDRTEPAWQIGDVLTLTTDQNKVVTTYTVK
jgi:cytoskeletal protein RodZ